MHVIWNAYFWVRLSLKAGINILTYGDKNSAIADKPRDALVQMQRRVRFRSNLAHNWAVYVIPSRETADILARSNHKGVDKGPNFLGNAGAPPLAMGHDWPLEIRPSFTCYFAEFIHSRSSNTTVITPEKFDPASHLSRSMNVIGIDTDRSATYNFLLTFPSNHGPTSYCFRDIRRFHPVYLTPLLDNDALKNRITRLYLAEKILSRHL